MRFTEFKPTLTESRGLASRTPGDTFVSDGGPDIAFRGVNFYPESGKFEPEDLTDAIADTEAEYGTITWLNQVPKSGGFGIVSFDLPNGDVAHYGRFFKIIKAMHDQMARNNKDIPGY